MARSLIARAWLSDATVDARLGRIVLRRAQRETVARANAALAEFGGALVADPPGAGKTIVALAVARGASDTLVVAPATLRTQWRHAAARTGIAIRFVSYESLGRGATPHAGKLVILDEAHHARNPATVRHRRLRAFLARSRVLLLTATPVVNRRADLIALLSLFLGDRAARLSRAELARCVLQCDDARAASPPVRRLAPLRPAIAVPGLGRALRSLPAPLPVADGGSAIALIRMTLALAWASSLAALDRALVRRTQRGMAILDVLDAGRAPTASALRHWVLAPDSTQLAFAPLVSDTPTAEGAPPASAAIEVVSAHLAAVRSMRALIRPFIAGDIAARAESLRELAASHPARRIVVFSRFAETVASLHLAMRREPGVVAVTGRVVRAAAGRWSRDEILARVGPRAGGITPSDPREVRLLIATDLLSEGVEMQGVGILVHADLPWTPARLEQRRGRLTRIGALTREVFETRFVAPAEATELVRLGARLRRKRRHADRATTTPGAVGILAGLLHEWARGPAGPRFALLDGPRSGFLALVREDGRDPLLVAGYQSWGSHRWRISHRADRVLPIARVAQGDERVAPVADVRRLTTLLRRFLARRSARAALGGSALRKGDGIARMASRIERILRRTRPIDRPPLASLAHGLHTVAEGSGSRALAERAPALMALTSDGEFVDEVRRLLAGVTTGPLGARIRPPCRLVAALILRPAERRAEATPATVPPSASPGTAALR